MTLKSAFEDLSRTTLEALYGCLRRLEYLAGLRETKGEYCTGGFPRFMEKPRHAKHSPARIAQRYPKCSQPRLTLFLMISKLPVSRREWQPNLIWKLWQISRKGYYQKTQVQGQLATLVQCCTLFWDLSGIGDGTPFAEPHSNAHNLAQNFG